MSNILITGGTGLLGRSLSGILSQDLVPHTLASRHKPSGGAEWCKLDLSNGEGMDEAVAGKKIIFHLASATRNPGYETDVDGTRRLIDAAIRNNVAHFIFISIVGIDKVPIKYYQIKLKTEQEIITSGIPYTILRATQFHEFVDFKIGKILKYPVGILPKEAKIQPVETRAVAWKLFQLSKGKPLNATLEMGGPEILTTGSMAKSWLKAGNKMRFLLSMPTIGPVLRALAAGGLTTKDHATDCQSWGDWLAEKYPNNNSFFL